MRSLKVLELSFFHRIVDKYSNMVLVTSINVIDQCFMFRYFVFLQFLK